MIGANTRVAFGTAAYVPYAVGCYTRTLQPVPGFHEFWSQRKPLCLQNLPL
ncbi:hypothetical protein FC50_GL000239 [Lacticaseibacillus pantheris DSM 15945 = JCM 12539 = NBRC 106106]|uniref:Uncharacterized protein n=1 Tax=Lacticaseibacillus pantheris DSM 15945 = JCM 12539 = NBRC 106106 TaxID=1423783 RepID=A0A0R1U0W0_9LACO|nr:hypothetical protein FC50_GL000239 [Lacticaseibacillus pantheris DSM 15945 = JCM 12539 = NBRC 106106]